MECFQSFLLVRRADSSSLSSANININTTSSSSSSCKQNATALTAIEAAKRRRNRFLPHRSHVSAAHALLIFMLMPFVVAKLTVAAPVDVDVASTATVPPIAAIAVEVAEVAKIEEATAAAAAAGHEASLPSNETIGEPYVTHVELQPIKTTETVEDLDSLLSNDQLEQNIRKDIQTEIESNLEAGASAHLEKILVEEQVNTINKILEHEDTIVLHQQHEENVQSKSHEESASLAAADEEADAAESKRGARNLDVTNDITEAQPISPATQSTTLENSGPHVNNTSTPSEVGHEKATDLDEEEEKAKSLKVDNEAMTNELIDEVTNKPEEEINETTEKAALEDDNEKQAEEKIDEAPHFQVETTSENPVAADAEKPVAELDVETHVNQDENILNEPATTNEIGDPKEEESALQTVVVSAHNPEEDIVLQASTERIETEAGNDETTEQAAIVTKINLLSIEDELENANAEETTASPELKDTEHQVFKKEGVILESSKSVEEVLRTGKTLEESPEEDAESRTETILTVELPVELEDRHDFVAKEEDQQEAINGLVEQPQVNADINSYVTVQPEATVVFFETTSTTESVNTDLAAAKNKDSSSSSSSEVMKVETEEDTVEDQSAEKVTPGVLEALIAASNKGSRSVIAEDAATAHRSYPPPNAGQTHQDNLAEEDATSGIGKALRSSSDGSNRHATNRSAMIIALCSVVAAMFIGISLAMFLISFRRQHGTLDIEMQEQRCGKDDLEEEDAELKLLEVELPPQTNMGTDETDECL